MVQTKTRILDGRPLRRGRFQFDVHMLPYAIVAVAIILVGVQVMIARNAFVATLPTSAYQAVFLRNGQVYFGHLTPMGGYFRLDDVYYIRENVQDTTAAAETDTETTTDTNAAAGEQPQFSVIRLGEEIHQPENLMVINKDDVMFWENLTPTSRVVEAIATEKESRE